MANLVNAYVIFNGTTNQYVGDQGISLSINCDRIASFSPRPVWLKRFLAPGDGTIVLYEPTFVPSSAELLDVNTVSGMWLEIDGQDVMLDITSVGAIQSACDSCCGAVPTIIANQYGGLVTAFNTTAINTVCIYRFDNGTVGDHENFAADYVGNFIGTAQLRSNFSGQSHYTIQTYWTVANFPLIGTDTIYAGACAS